MGSKLRLGDLALDDDLDRDFHEEDQGARQRTKTTKNKRKKTVGDDYMAQRALKRHATELYESR